MGGLVLDLTPLKPEDVPDPSTPQFQTFLDDHFTYGDELIQSMDEWNNHSTQHKGTVQVVTLTSSSSYSNIRKKFSIKEFWCGRVSIHTADNVRAHSHSQTHEHDPEHQGSGTFSPSSIARTFSRRFSRITSHQAAEQEKHVDVNGNGDTNGNGHGRELSEVERQEAVMSSPPQGLYERFRRGLLEYHSENEREYIESCRETECLHVFQPHVAEVWRLTYVTPPPTSPRTFVVLLLSREVRTEGDRCFMNISIPYADPSCPEKSGGEKSRVRGKYVSVERVSEKDNGARVEWRMATSSDAGGNIPRFVTNASLPSKISEDVPSFISWMTKRFPSGGDVASSPVAPAH